MKRSSLVVFSLIVVGLAGAALAATSGPKPDETGGRYSMTPTANGVVRLDTQTGAMSLCTRHRRPVVLPGHERQRAQPHG